MTIREIARRCGVSRGTVDRVLNDRGKVHPDTEARVRKALAEAGYTKNIAGRALTVRKQAPVIGVLLSSEGNPFFGEVIEGIHCAEAELEDYGVRIALRGMRGYDTGEQLAHIVALSEEISALVLQPVNDRRVAGRVQGLAERGIPTVTVNTDLPDSVRRCYVGSDYEKGGETAAGVVRLVTGGTGNLGIITGVESVLGHVQRLRGFENRLRAVCPEMKILARESAQDDIARAYEVTRRMLVQHPGMDALMVITAGLEGVCRAVAEAGRGDVRVFAFDNIPATEGLMRQGLVPAVICQQPFQQGYQAVWAAYDIILTGTVQQERRIMENQIKILENL